MSLQQQTDFGDVEIRLQQVKFQYPEFVVIELSKIINEEIVDEIHSRMEAKGISKKIINETFLDVFDPRNKDIVIIHIKSTYRAETGVFPVVFIEKGRRAFFLSPVKRLALSWLQQGTRFFSKGHEIPEKKADPIIAETIAERVPVVQSRFRKAEKEWVESILKS